MPVATVINVVPSIIVSYFVHGPATSQTNRLTSAMPVTDLDHVGLKGIIIPLQKPKRNMKSPCLLPEKESI